MIRLVRQPTIRTLLALTVYVAILCRVYQLGDYERDQQRDIWFALPFALLPFCLPAVVRSASRLFWGCFAVFFSIAALHETLGRPPLAGINPLLLYAKALSLLPERVWLPKYDAERGVLVILLSAVYAFTAVLAAKAYRDRDT